MRSAVRLLLAAGLAATALPAAAAEIDVPAGPGALRQAIASAAPGDVLRLGPGPYAGPVTIDRPLTLRGTGLTMVRGTGEGSVITIEAPGVTLSGLTVQGSGIRLDALDAGITIDKTAGHAVIEDNTVIGNLIGVNIHGGQDVVVRSNRIIGREDLRKNERGPGIYVWNAPGLLVEDNDIARGRDGVFITTSHHAVYRNNRISDLRFAFHSMYANDIEVTGNVSRGNDMGYAFMFSRGLTVTDNLSDGDRTHGIFMNFANKATIRHNDVRNGGDKCLFIYNSNGNRFEANRFEGCGIGVHFTAGSEGNAMTGNAFVNNRIQVKYVGTRWLEWSVDGHGNYWSDHGGFDVNGDGLADSHYRPNDLVDRITWSQPMARLLLGSPAVQLIRWSQSRFPGLLPGGVIDSHPLMSPDGAGLTPAAEPREGGPS
ncbi:carbohydrate-binding protein [Zhengella mangrovi]|uniref:Carbohydrate-binding protein n=1 Tax=Zhengella mangrovi TaxID=1982044 RepID=A0A2G1QR74_9HYPH|nr:nitrous oxide reductase family maturation protein NosD [Zhengella mangrovi]PHP67708.1 carbohydrate-binding protein [Zhengella mangrovi]